MQPHYSQSSRENTTSSSGTSQLGRNYPPPPPLGTSRLNCCHEAKIIFATSGVALGWSLCWPQFREDLFDLESSCAKMVPYTEYLKCQKRIPKHQSTLTTRKRSTHVKKEAPSSKMKHPKRNRKHPTRKRSPQLENEAPDTRKRSRELVLFPLFPV